MAQCLSKCNSVGTQGEHRRTVPLCSLCLNVSASTLFIDWINLWLEQKANGVRLNTWDNGEPFKPNYVSRCFGRILAKYDLPKIRYHELRHTAGSILLNSGLSMKQIQEYLGHEQVSTTIDIYGHLSIEGKKESAGAKGKLLISGAN